MPKSSKPKKLPAGSINLIKVKMTSQITNNELDLKYIIDEINIFESLNNSFIKVDLIVSESLGLVSWFPFRGEEFIEIEFETPDPAFEKSIKLMVFVYAVKNLNSKNPRSARYSIHCCSMENILDWKTKVRKSYRSMPPGEMVTEIFNSYLKSKKELKNVAETEGLRTIVIPNMSPSKAIKFLCRESKSPNYKSSNFVFYEDCDSFHFTTLDQLISPVTADRREHLPGKPTDKYVTAPFDTGNKIALDDNSGGPSGSSKSKKPFEFRKIVNYDFVNLFDNERLLHLGGIESVLRIVDIVHGSYIQKNYNYLVDAEDFKKTIISRETPLLTESAPYFSDGSAKVDFIPSNKTSEPEFPDLKEDMLHYKNASFALLDNITVDVTIPGDSEKRVGQVIELEFPEWSGIEEEIPKRNKFLSGEYLITALRHIYNSSGYFCVMRCVKNALEIRGN